jgi:ElaB/YqjD/DUF883 family membrane-anchored ribosome-binding protein
MINPTALREAAGHMVQETSAAANMAAHATQKFADDSFDSIRETTQRLIDTADDASSRTRGYIKHEPVKAVLIAAATGAALMALLSLVNHTRQRR